MFNRIYSFMGLAAKAGKLVSGEFACERSVKHKEACLVIVAEDASDNTKKKFSDMCCYRGVPIRCFGQKVLIGRYTGKETRAVVAILDENFSKKLTEMIDSAYSQFGGD